MWKAAHFHMLMLKFVVQWLWKWLSCMNCYTQNGEKRTLWEEGQQLMAAGVFIAARWYTVSQSKPIKEHWAVTCRLGRRKQARSVNAVTTPLHRLPCEKPRTFINIPPFFSARKEWGVVDTKWHCAPLRVWVTLQGWLWWGGTELGRGPPRGLKRAKLITQAWDMLDKMRKHKVVWMTEKRTGHHLLWG